MVSLLIAEGGCGSTPQLLSVEASESALGLLPSIALPSAQSGVDSTAAERDLRLCGGS
jgi:hypothetical protein